MSNKKTSTSKKSTAKKSPAKASTTKKTAPKKVEAKKEVVKKETKKKESFFSKHGAWIVIFGLLAIFGTIIVATGDSDKKPRTSNEALVSMSVDEWQASIKEDAFVVTTLAQTTCSWCNQFKPVAESVAEKYNFQIVWIDVDTLASEDEYNKLTGTFEELQNFGTPLTLITKNGEIVDQVSGYVEEDSFVSTLKKVGVIK